MVRVFAHGIPKCTFLSEKQFLIVFSLQETLSRSFTSPLLFSYEISLRISWVVERHARERGLSAEAGKLEDLAAALGAEMRHDCASELDRRDDVGVVLFSRSLTHSGVPGRCPLNVYWRRARMGSVRDAMRRFNAEDLRKTTNAARRSGRRSETAGCAESLAMPHRPRPRRAATRSTSPSVTRSPWSRPRSASCRRRFAAAACRRRPP